MAFPTAGWVYQPFEGARLVNSAPAPAKQKEYRVATINGGSPLRLELGGELPFVEVAYETYGELASAGDNCILVCHALTGDSHVASHPGSKSEPGWWEPLVGPGKPLDTRRYFVVCANVLGGCSGSTGPTSRNPRTGSVYGRSFPDVTVRDMVRVQAALLKALGVERVQSVLGGSMGGMQALEWCVAYPEMVARSVVIGAPGRIRAQAVAFNEVQRHAIHSDPKWNNGDYPIEDGPAQGLAIARMLGMITYQCEESMERKFGPTRARGGRGSGQHDWSKVQQYLRYQGDKLVNRFDANSYLCLLKALDLFDLSGETDYRGAISKIRAQVLVIGISSDILYPTHQQRELVADLREAGVRAEYHEITSSLGHDAFLLEFNKLGPVLRQFMDA